MLNIAVKIIPEPVKNILRLLRSSLITPIQKKLLVKRMRIKHEQLLTEKKEKEKIKIVFLELFKSMWKLDPVFRKMLEDPYFEPIILVCPCVSYGDNAMWTGMQETISFFEEKNYPIISAYDNLEQKWLSLKEIDPDIVFFSIPHNMTRQEYYSDAYLNYLSCFCGYGYIISELGDKVSNFNQHLHNALWRNFATDEYAYSGFKKYSTAKGLNSILTGFPIIEDLIKKKSNNKVWKTNDTRIKIIFAPHHSIKDILGFKLSNFLEYAHFFQELSTKYKKDIVWCFKPHPELKSKLYQHSDWGVEKTDNYYNFWRTQENTQFDDGEYIDLFIESDAMIHDCGTFLIEYLTQKKPVLYLISEKTHQTLSPLAMRAIQACTQAKNKNEIEQFICSLIAQTARIKDEHTDFYEQEFIPLYHKNQPSKQIIQEIKQYTSDKSWIENV